MSSKEEIIREIERKVDVNKLAKDKKQLIIADNLHDKLTFEEIKTIAMKLSDRYREKLNLPYCLIFPIIPNFEEELEVSSRLVGGEGDSAILFAIKKDGEYASLTDVFGITPTDFINRRFNTHYGIKRGKENSIYHLLVKGELKAGKYKVKGLRYDRVTGKNVFLNNYLIPTQVIPIKEKYDMPKISKVTDLSPLYDLDNKKSRLTDIETYILYSIFGFGMEEIGVNLIIIGDPRIGKSLILRVLCMSLDEQEIDGALTRTKAFTPTFWGSETKAGLFADVKYVIPVNEIFRFLLKQVNVSQRDRSLAQELSNFTGIFERTERKIGSGKWDVEKYVVDKAFLSTTNTDIIKDAIGNIWQQGMDPAPLYRLTFLELDLLKPLEANIDRLETPDYTERYFKEITSKKTIKDTVLYLYDKKSSVKIDPKRSSKVQREVNTTGGYISPKASALLRTIVLINSLIRKEHKLVAIPEDYEILKKCLDKLDKSFTQLLISRDELKITEVK